MKKMFMLFAAVLMMGILTSFTSSTSNVDATVDRAADITAVVNLVPNTAMELMVPVIRCTWTVTCCFRQPGFIYCGYVNWVYCTATMPSATCTHCGNPWCERNCEWVCGL